jgi:hypothetical protein
MTFVLRSRGIMHFTSVISDMSIFCYLCASLPGKPQEQTDEEIMQLIKQFIYSFRNQRRTWTLSLDLLAEDVLEGDGVSSEFRDTLAELLDGHLVLVEVEAELGLVVDVRLLLEVQLASVLCDELLGDLVLRVVELLEQVGLHSLACCCGNSCEFALTAMVR